MENNLNYKGIEEYSRKLSQQIVGQVFANTEKVGGKDILDLTPIRQVNLFIIKNLFAEWQREAGNIKSPYFDYENGEVRQALKNLMNILSQHIAVDSKHLLPLLQDAIKETFLLVFSPYDFYTHQIPANESLSAKALKSYAKYVKINEKIYKSFLEKLEEDQVRMVDRATLLKVLNEVFENTEASPEDVNQYLAQFSDLLLLDESIIYGEVSTPATKEEPEEDTPDSESKQKNVAPLNEKHDPPLKVLNDELAEEAKSTLADIHHNQKITSIEKYLSINQRYMFVKVLFAGDEDAFKQTIDHLESLDDTSKAIQYIKEKHPDWDFESEEVEEFTEIVEKRLA